MYKTSPRNMIFPPPPRFRYSFLQHNDLRYCSTLQLQTHIWSWAPAAQIQQWDCSCSPEFTVTGQGQARQIHEKKTGDQYWAPQRAAVSVHMHCKFIQVFYKQHKERELLKRVIKRYRSCLQGPFLQYERIAQEKAQKCSLALTL